uniref:Uncharacterized protein n=1 Tax=Romanomermis culicivorax TaxID=13658 RepID=A0A915I171_ROMCU
MQLETPNDEEEGASEEPFVKILSEIAMQEENKAKLEKVKTRNFQQPAVNPNDRIKYRRGLGKRGQALNKALKEGKLDMSYSSRAASLDRARNNEMAQQGAPMCDTNAMIQAQQQMSYLPPNYPGLPVVGFDCLNRLLFPGQLLASTVVPPPTQFQMAQFPMMQQGPYYHQFLVPAGIRMPPPTLILPMGKVQGEEMMDIPRPSMVVPPPQRPPSAANPN